MRKISIFLAILVVLLVGGALVAVSNLNGYLEDNRDRLAALASEAAGREVSFARAEVAFAGGLAVRVAGLRVGEDARFGEIDFLGLEEAYVGVRILPALRGRVEVSGIRLGAPQIRIIQTDDGFNFSSLGGAGQAAPARAPEKTDSGTRLAVAIAVLEISDGTIVIEDRSVADGLALVIEDFESSGTDLALDGPLSIDFAGRVRSTKPTEAGLESRIEGEVDLASLDPLAGTLLLRSPSLVPAIFGVRFEQGSGVEHVDDLRVVVDLAANSAGSGFPVTVRSRTARLSGFDLEDIAIDVVYRDSPRGAELDLDQVAMGLAGGRLDLSGGVVLGAPGASPFDLEARVRDLDSGQLASALMGVSAGALSGRLDGDVVLSGDSLEWESLKKSLAGRLRLEIGEGALEQVNLLDAFVDRLSADPGLGRLAASAIRNAIPEVFAGDRTPFEGIDLALEIAQGAIQAKEVSLSAGDFALQAAGRVSLDGAVVGDGTLRLSQTLSRKILEKAGPLGRLLGQGDRVSLPLRFGGTTRALSLMPDLDALAGSGQRDLEDRAARELTDRLFGKPRDGEDAQRERDSAEGLIREGIGRLFGR